MARWYARQRGTARGIAEVRREAARLAASYPQARDVLEVAPGPGYLAIELARLGHFQVTGLDISRTMVEIATGNARKSAQTIDFQLGDASAMPFAAGSFDLIVCQAAFKNFRRPVDALDEMHRVLRAGGTAVIQDMNRDASNDDISREVGGMGLNRLNRLFVRLTFLTFLRRRAYSPARFRSLVAGSAFRACDITAAGIGIEVRLTKPAPAAVAEEK